MELMRGDQRRKHGEDESKKRNKCWTVHCLTGLRLLFVEFDIRQAQRLI